jgi:putative ABC transport system permease protein
MQWPWQRKDEELDDEIRQHLEMAARERMERGESAEQARLNVRREFGNVGLVKEVTREMWGWASLERLGQDLRFGLRLLAKLPSFTLIAVLTLALGIGATTAMFSVVNALVLNPFPYHDHQRLFLVRQSLPKLGVRDQLRASGAEFSDFAAAASFAQVAAWEPVSRNLTGGQEPERVAPAKVSAEFFAMLGIEPLLGRVMRPDKQGTRGARVLVISYGLWQRRFGGEPGVIGRQVALDDEPYTIIGVMPQRFWFGENDCWFPFPFDLNAAPRDSARIVPVLAKLKPEVTDAQAQAELALLAQKNEQAFAKTHPEYVGRSLYLQPLREFVFGSLRQVTLILLGAVTLVLLIACANLANLLLVRAAARAPELAVRIALGASRGRLIRQLLTESFLLSVIGGALGVLSAWLALDALVRLIPQDKLSASVAININGGVLFFAIAVSLLTTMLCGLWPAWQSSGAEAQAGLQAATQRATAQRGQRRLQSALVVTEVSLSFILLVMAGLMLRSFARLTNVDTGFQTENLLSLRLTRSPAKSDGGKRLGAFFQQLADRVATAPGVKGVAVASHMPFDFTEDGAIKIENSALPIEQRTQTVDTRTVSANYFSVLGIPLLQGESFSAGDADVAVINQTLAQRCWPQEDALGKRFKLGSADSSWFVVKGVVADSNQGSFDASIKPEAYFALGQMAGRYRRMNLAIRTQGDPLALAPQIQKEIWAVDREQAVYQVQTMEQMIGKVLGTRRFALVLLLLFSGVAVTLAALGIYGVIAYAVAQRTHEIGIRLALGARAIEVLRLVIGQGLRPVLLGTALGLLGAFALTRVMESLLYGVSATDPLTFAAIVAFLFSVALLACWLPARRATKVNPLIALRCE